MTQQILDNRYQIIKLHFDEETYATIRERGAALDWRVVRGELTGI